MTIPIHVGNVEEMVHGRLQLQIRLDKRLELLFTVMILSDYRIPGFAVDGEDIYTQKIRERFSAVSGLNAVADFPKVWDTDINWDTIHFYALALSNDYSIRKGIDPAYIEQGLKANASLSVFTENLREFARASGFDAYYDNLETEMGGYLEKLNGIVASRPVQSILEEYLGIRFPKTEVFLSTLMKPFMSVTIPAPGGDEVYCICSRRGLEIAEENGGLERILLSAIWHEFSHHIVNPLTFGLFDDPDTLRDDQVEWCCALNESIIWAINTRLLVREKIISENDVSWMVSNGERNKAPKTRIMHDLLLEYESNRNSYSGISAFHPIMAEAFGQVPR
jgi:hypothetical protein